jgi:hypothetical protein
MGQIFSPAGTPVANLRVAAVEVPNENTALSATLLIAGLVQTDIDGRYRLDGIPPGRYYIMAGRFDDPTYYPGAKTPGTARAITVSDSATLMGIDLVLKQPLQVKVTGKLLKQAGSTGRGTDVMVHLVPVRRAGADALSFQLDGPEPYEFKAADGTFEFRDVKPGDYTIELNGSRGFVMSVPGKNDVDQFSVIRVVDDDVNGLTVASVEQAVLQSDAGQAVDSRLRAWVDKKKKEFDVRKKEIDEITEAQKLSSDSSARVELTRLISRKKTELNRALEDTERELDQMRHELFSPIVKIAEKEMARLISEKATHGETGISEVVQALIQGELITRINAAISSRGEQPTK